MSRTIKSAFALSVFLALAATASSQIVTLGAGSSGKGIPVVTVGSALLVNGTDPALLVDGVNPACLVGGC